MGFVQLQLTGYGQMLFDLARNTIHTTLRLSRNSPLTGWLIRSRRRQGHIQVF